jgi:hypothetical protein
MLAKVKATRDWLIYLGVFIFSLIGFYYLIIDGVDYFWTYYPVTINWLEGRTQLYDELSRGLYNTPWLIWLLAPFTQLPYQFGLSVLRAISILIMVYTIFSLTEKVKGYSRLLSLALGIFNLHILDLIIRGQIDAFTVLGVILGLQSKNWTTSGLAYVFLAIKPPNTIPIMVYFFIRTWQLKGYREALKGLIIPIGVFLLSLVLHGLWFVRWFQSYQATAPFDTWKVTIWRAAEVLNLPVVLPLIFVIVVIGIAIWLWRYAETSERQVLLLIVTTYMVTIYALSYHYCLILAVVFPILIAWQKWVGIGLYLLTFLPLIRLYTGLAHSYIDLIFVSAVFMATAFWLVNTAKKKPLLFDNS